MYRNFTQKPVPPPLAPLSGVLVKPKETRLLLFTTDIKKPSSSLCLQSNTESVKQTSNSDTRDELYILQWRWCLKFTKLTVHCKVVSCLSFRKVQNERTKNWAGGRERGSAQWIWSEEKQTTEKGRREVFVCVTDVPACSRFDWQVRRSRRIVWQTRGRVRIPPLMHKRTCWRAVIVV